MGGYCGVNGSGGIAVFNIGLFWARYPAFRSVDPGLLASYFAEAGLYLNNTPVSIVVDVQRRLVLLNMLVAHISFLNGDLEPLTVAPAPVSVQLQVASTAPGPFTVAHGLGVVPTSITVTATSPGAIWASSPVEYDATNLYLNASDANVTATVNVFQTSQFETSGGQARPVGRLNQASEGSVSASFDYGAASAGSGEWFNQSQYGAAFWQATSSYRTMHYVPGPWSCGPVTIYGRGFWPR
jgi:hypothetical protein